MLSSADNGLFDGGDDGDDECRKESKVVSGWL
jgi:hypothetical protein